jgi:hypothetical protein
MMSFLTPGGYTNGAESPVVMPALAAKLAQAA